MGLIEIAAKKSKDLNSGPPVTIAFLGDSVTQGCFELVKDRNGKIDTVFEQEAAYHQLLKQRLAEIYPSAPITVINAGISGNSAGDGYGRLKRDVLQYSPDLVVVCFGLNDCMKGKQGLKDYEWSLTNIFEELRASAIPVVFMTPNMMNTYIHPSITDVDFREMAQETMDVQNSGILDLYVDKARKTCERFSFPVCDCYRMWKTLAGKGTDITSLLSNHINHPTRNMHHLFAEELFRSIVLENI
ncbi:SGNH/GDSL hydrolase family protein [Sediminibacillus massiliensis]|uniref:SGNH/GDSL hydrolase family protein n=1 Tax=Sediminibacillus massiliensis TaxID=1926277 RepID=UPI0015C39B87|nr:SGNH/GDSL hydrolase family protein [Sediminibacillus massiliensis]